MVDRTHGAVMTDATDHAVQLIVDALLAVRAGEIFGGDFAVEVETIGNVSLGFQELEVLRLGGRMPLLAFALQLRFDDRALLAIAVQLLELFARTVVETLRALGLRAFGFIHGPILVSKRVADALAFERRAAFLQWLRDGAAADENGCSGDRTHEHRGRHIERAGCFALHGVNPLALSIRIQPADRLVAIVVSHPERTEPVALTVELAISIAV